MSIIPFVDWRGGRVAEGARLESVYTATYRGFESLSLRQFTALELSGCKLSNSPLNPSTHGL